MLPWAPKGRLILPSGAIFKDSKNLSFFNVAFGRRKIYENRALARSWPLKAAPGNRRYLVPGAGGLTDRPIIKEIGDRLQVVWI